MDKLWNEIKRLADSNNGFIRTSDIETAGISRMVLRKYVDAGKLEQIRKGLYTLSDDLAERICPDTGTERKSNFFLRNSVIPLGIIGPHTAYL